MTYNKGKMLQFLYACLTGGTVPVCTIDPEIIAALSLQGFPHRVQRMKGESVHLFELPREMFLP